MFNAKVKYNFKDVGLQLVAIDKFHSSINFFLIFQNVRPNGEATDDRAKQPPIRPATVATQGGHSPATTRHTFIPTTHVVT